MVAPPSHSEDQQMFPAFISFLAILFTLNLQQALIHAWGGGAEPAGVGVERAVTWYSQPCTLPPIVKWPWTKAKQEAASNLRPGAWGVRPATDSLPSQ